MTKFDISADLSYNKIMLMRGEISMEKQDYFKKALSNFTFEMASGGAIRYLTDEGYTVRQIAERLDFPTPVEKIQKAVWARLLENGTLLIEEPGSRPKEPKYTYIKEYNQYGRPSFRRVTVEESETDRMQNEIILHEQSFTSSIHGSFSSFITEKCTENGASFSYVSLDFGLKLRTGRLQTILNALNTRQAEYLQGLPWEPRRVYHRLDKRMQEIIIQLYENQLYSGACYFLKTGEKIIF